MNKDKLYKKIIEQNKELIKKAKKISQLEETIKIADKIIKEFGLKEPYPTDSIIIESSDKHWQKVLKLLNKFDLRR